MTKDSENLIWVDLEMTGLNTQLDKIIEIATVITDKDLNAVAEGPMIAVHQSEDVLNTMDEWNTRQHTKSGLIDRVRTSQVSEREAERKTLAFLSAHIEARTSPMCGNSICQDRRFMANSMPELEAFFHYRNIDVSTLKELARRWAPNTVAGFSKTSTHLALDDIRESIEELKYYREHLFTY
jgi:oligoribonuclease